MKSNINKLIMIEVIAGILFAFIASKIQHMTEALQIMYLPFELIGKGLRVLSLSSAIGNVIAIIIYAAISMIPAIYVIYQRKRGRTHKEDILLVVFTGLLFYSLYMFINPGLMYQKMPDIFSMDQSSLIVMKIIYAFIIYSVPIMWLIMKAIRFLGDDSQKNWKSRLYFGMKGLIAALVSYYTLLITYAKTFELLHKSENKLQNVSSIEWFKSVLQLLPIIMTILLFINIIHVVKAIEDHKEEAADDDRGKTCRCRKGYRSGYSHIRFYPEFLSVFAWSNLTECKCHVCARCIHGTIDHSIWSVDLP